MIHIIVSYDQNISLIFYVKDGTHPSCVYAPRDSTLQYKRCVHLWTNFPCIITLLCDIYWPLCAIISFHESETPYMTPYMLFVSKHLFKCTVQLFGRHSRKLIISSEYLSLLWTVYTEDVCDPADPHL